MRCSRANRLVLAVGLVLLAPAAFAADEAPPAPPPSVRVLDAGGAPLRLRMIPRGRFVMGSPANESGRGADETAHPVMLSRDVWMGEAPITRGQFARFVDDAHYATDAEKAEGGAGWDGRALVPKKTFTWRSPGVAQTDEHPVVLVSWNDANAYASWASTKVGRRVRLPTEAEWERAARAATATRHPDGETDAVIREAGWVKENAASTTHPVGTKPPNPWGFLDTTGNVLEWCRDVYVPYVPGPLVDPEIAGPPGSEPERRVLRGGSWLRPAKDARPAARDRAPASTRSAEIGFRVVVTDEDAIGPGGPTAPDFAPASPVPLAPEGPKTPAEVPPPGGPSSAILLAIPAALAVVWLIARRRAPPPPKA